MASKPTDTGPIVAPASSHCDSNSLTDSYGLFVQVILAGLAFASLILKRFYCEPREQRRTWTIWFFDTSKQAVGAGVIHFLNVFLAEILHQQRGDPCTWYVVSFLLDSTLGLLIIYSGVRLVSCLASFKDWPTLRFGEYGKPAECRAWFHQCAVFVGIILVEKIVITLMMEFRFWHHVREIILSPITNPKLEVTIVMLIIPFFMNTLIFWVVDNFTMRKTTRSPVNNELDDDEMETGSFSKGRKPRKNGKLTYVSLETGSGEADNEDGERLLPEDDIFTAGSSEIDVSGPRESDGLLEKKECQIHLRHNSVSLI